MAKGHVMVLPMPCQGRVVPLMELSHRLVDHGFEVTFVNTEVDHALVLAALPDSKGGGALRGIHLASIPDGLADDEDRKDLNKLIDAYSRHMPGYLEALVAEMEAAGRPKVKWLVGDVNMGWSFPVARKLGIRVASFWPASMACLAIMLKISNLIQDGVLNDKGWPEREETLELAPGMPPLLTSLLSWNHAGPPEGQHIIFQLVCRNNKFKDLAEITVCNSFREAEPGAFDLFPDVLPIGPLFADAELQKPVGQFLPEDTSCLGWLDARPDSSVVYVAFGTMAIFDARQFQELAEGLELTGRPFLWVMRPDFTPGLSKPWLDEFRQRVSGRGVIVSWCPQQRVLAHRAVACFVSHCGWNSTMEAARNGVPVLCWPYFCDQFLDRSYFTDVWRTGLAVSSGNDGVVVLVDKEEVRRKVEMLVGDEGIRERARGLKDAAARQLVFSRKGELGSLLFPGTVAREAIFGNTPSSHLARRRFVVALASGGRFGGGRVGNRGSRPVYSVGLGRVPAGGAMEAEESSVRSFGSARFPSGDGALRSSGVARPTSLSPAVFGSAVLLVPRPGPACRRIWNKKVRVKMVFTCSATMATALGVGSTDPAIGDFPVAMGLAPIQGVKRSSGSGAPPTAPVRRLSWNPEGPSCNFLLFLGFSGFGFSCFSHKLQCTWKLPGTAQKSSLLDHRNCIL